MTDPTGSALMARIKELEEALRPFAAIIYCHDWPDDYNIDDSNSVCCTLTFADIRNAAKALNK